MYTHILFGTLCRQNPPAVFDKNKVSNSCGTRFDLTHCTRTKYSLEGPSLTIIINH